MFDVSIPLVLYVVKVFLISSLSMCNSVLLLDTQIPITAGKNCFNGFYYKKQS